MTEQEAQAIMRDELLAFWRVAAPAMLIFGALLLAAAYRLIARIESRLDGVIAWADEELTELDHALLMQGAQIEGVAQQLAPTCDACLRGDHDECSGSMPDSDETCGCWAGAPADDEQL